MDYIEKAKKMEELRAAFTYFRWKMALEDADKTISENQPKEIDTKKNIFSIGFAKAENNQRKKRVEEATKDKERIGKAMIELTTQNSFTFEINEENLSSQMADFLNDGDRKYLQNALALAIDISEPENLPLAGESLDAVSKIIYGTKSDLSDLCRLFKSDYKDIRVSGGIKEPSRECLKGFAYASVIGPKTAHTAGAVPPEDLMKLNDLILGAAAIGIGVSGIKTIITNPDSIYRIREAVRKEPLSDAVFIAAARLALFEMTKDTLSKEIIKMYKSFIYEDFSYYRKDIEKLVIIENMTDKEHQNKLEASYSAVERLTKLKL